VRRTVRSQSGDEAAENEVDVPAEQCHPRIGADAGVGRRGAVIGLREDDDRSRNATRPADAPVSNDGDDEDRSRPSHSTLVCVKAKTPDRNEWCLMLRKWRTGRETETEKESEWRIAQEADRGGSNV